jgi:hypothetical protein
MKLIAPTDLCPCEGGKLAKDCRHWPDIVRHSYHIRDDGGVVAMIGGKVVNFATVPDAIKAGVIPKPQPLITPDPKPKSAPIPAAPAQQKETQPAKK